jgi:hypothetical protein
MRRLSIFLWLMAAVPANAAANEQAGFICTATDGSTMRINIDLKKRRFDDGNGWKALHQVTDTLITLRGPNPDMISTPMGPVFASLALDRATLVLTDQTLVPDRNISRTVQYQCAKVAPIDFKAQQKF